MSHQQVLLLKDVNDERAGEIARVRAGFARNYLYPKGLAVKATNHAIRLQEKLREERAKQAVIDKKDAEKTAGLLKDKIYETLVKVDPAGHMYGSVSAADVAEMITAESGVQIARKQVQLAHPLKTTGVHEVTILFKEGVTATVSVKVVPEGVVEAEVDETAGVAAGEEAPSLEEELGESKQEDKPAGDEA